MKGKKREGIDSPLPIDLSGGYTSNRPLRGQILPHIIKRHVKRLRQPLNDIPTRDVASFFDLNNSRCGHAGIFRKLFNINRPAQSPVFQPKFQFIVHGCIPLISFGEYLFVFILKQDENKSNTFSEETEIGFKIRCKSFTFVVSW
jgi:hypothetical protein